MKNAIEFYNIQKEFYAKAVKQNPNLKVEDFIDSNPTKYKLDKSFKKRFKKE